MSQLVSIIGVMFTVAFFTLAHGAKGDAYGQHGMVLFESSGQLASHMPLYQAPHNFQIILALTWPQLIQESIQKQKAAKQLITLLPNAFDLTRLQADSEQPLHELTFDIYLGHFERGGTPVHRQVPAKIKQVLLFHQLSETAISHHSSPAQARAFIPFQWDEQQFLLERIRYRPTEDRIYQILSKPAPDLPSLIEVKTTQDHTIQDALSAWGIEALQLVYREWQDFQ